MTLRADLAAAEHRLQQLDNPRHPVTIEDDDYQAKVRAYREACERDVRELRALVEREEGE